MSTNIHHHIAAVFAEHGAGAETDEALALCADAECGACATIVCPHEDPFHFHHDGCPSCAEMGEEAPL